MYNTESRPYTTTDQVLRQKADFDTVVRNLNLTVKPCDLCGSSVGVRNVRQSPILCANCVGKQSAMSRYQNFQHNKLTDAEKNAILNSRTTRVGPFFSGKK